MRGVPSVVPSVPGVVRDVGLTLSFFSVYMKKSEQQMQSLRQMPPHVPHALSVCAKCGATVAVARFEAKTTPDDAKDDARPPTTPHVEHVMPESALYAISGQDFGEKSARAPEGFLGVILGHVAEELDAVYSAESNPLARGGASGARIHCSASQCSSAPDSEVARIALRWPELEPEHALYASVASGQDTPTDPGEAPRADHVLIVSRDRHSPIHGIAARAQRAALGPRGARA